MQDNTYCFSLLMYLYNMTIHTACLIWIHLAQLRTEDIHHTLQVRMQMVVFCVDRFLRREREKLTNIPCLYVMTEKHLLSLHHTGLSAELPVVRENDRIASDYDEDASSESDDVDVVAYNGSHRYFTVMFCVFPLAVVRCFFFVLVRLYTHFVLLHSHLLFFYISALCRSCLSC